MRTEPPTSVAERLASVLGGVAGALHRIGGLVFLPALVLVVGYDIFTRYVLAAPSLWANEMSTVLLPAVFFLSLAQVTLRGSHLATDILYMRLGPRLRRVADIASGCLGLLFLGILFWGMGNALRGSLQYREGTQNIGFPYWPVYAVIILCLAVATLMFLTRAIYALLGREDVLSAAVSSDET